MKLNWNRSLLLLALLGVVLYFAVNVASGYMTKQEESSPEPSVTKPEAADAALAFARLQFGVTSADTFVTYQTHKIRSTYLERRNLANEYEKKFGSLYPLDYFTVELKNRAGGPHLFVDINFTTRSVLGWGQAAAVKAAQTVDRTKGEAVAHRVMKERGLNPNDFTLVADASQPESRFTFQSKTASVGEAKLRIQIDVSGDTVTGYSPVFTIPQDHLDWLNRQDSAASIMTWASMSVMFVMAAAGCLFGILHRKQAIFSRGVLLTLIYIVFYCTNNINMLPGLKAEQGDAVSTYATLATVLFVNFVTLLMAAGLYVSCVSGTELWRRFGWNPWPRWHESSFGQDVFAAMGRGYLICFLALGVQQLLFFIAEHAFRVWAVNDASSSPYNLLVPALFPLLAWCAGISEEATFRLFGIAFFTKLVRVRFLAVLIPSVIWAASHTQYPIYPVYTRLVEVSILGLIFGYSFLKYGFMTVVFAHSTMDSVLMGLDLVSNNQMPDVIMGVFYMLSPLLIGWLIAWLHFRSQRRRPSSPETAL